MIDNNGYVIISENHNETGEYFGEVPFGGAIMESMIEMEIFKKLTVYDFQALCSEEIEIKSSAMMLLTVCSK